MYYCSDIESLKTIDILYGGVWLEVLVDDYVVNFDGNTCAFCITNSNSDSLAILGDALMRNFYIVHDMDNM